MMIPGHVQVSCTIYHNAYIIMRIVCEGTNRTLGFPAGWRFVGGAAPATINAGKNALIQLWSLGTNDAEVVAQYVVEP